MEREQKGLERFDKLREDVEKYLGAPLEVPHKTEAVKNKKGEKVTKEVRDIPLDFFLLPPKEVDPRVSLKRRPLFGYAGKGPVRVYVAAMDRGAVPEEFQGLVCRTLGLSPQREAKRETKSALGGKALEFDKIEARSANGASRFLVYILRRDPDRFAVVYQMANDKVKEEAVKQTLEASLRSLEIGDRAALLRNAYNRQDRKASFYRLLMQSW
jgi:hypothetical protein